MSTAEEFGVVVAGWEEAGSCDKFGRGEGEGEEGFWGQGEQSGAGKWDGMGYGQGEG